MTLLRTLLAVFLVLGWAVETHADENATVPDSNERATVLLDDAATQVASSDGLERWRATGSQATSELQEAETESKSKQDLIFSDGFEGGGLGAWSAFVPEPGCSTTLVMPTAVTE
jgi:hypothetical protein